MTVTQQIITIALCALATMMTRFLPFLLFSGKRKTPEYINYLGEALPAAIFSVCLWFIALKTSALHQAVTVCPSLYRSAF